jgi:hypothetical protein
MIKFGLSSRATNARILDSRCSTLYEKNSPDYSSTEEKPSHNVNERQALPQSIGLYLVGRHPLRSKGDGSYGPGLSVTSTSLCPQPPGLASRSGSQEGKAGAIRKPAHRNAPVSKSRRCSD